jgi:glyoxylase-like metal-dependent hydrolase (beta-lactamase superfamily II)
MGADSWVEPQVSNPIAILNTHGHFDHVWSNQALKSKYNIPIYCPKDDVFMLQDDPFSQGTPSSEVDIKAEEQSYNIGGLEVKYHHFAGHTPGCSAITIKDEEKNQNIMFSGDFIFANSIGRVDFPYSVPQDMKNSINKVLNWNENEDYIIYSGHGASTSLNQERASLKNWLNYI